MRVPNFPANSDEYFYAMLLLLLPHRSEKDICQPFDSYKEAFMHKHKDFDTLINHTYFSFSKQVENSMRRMRVLEQGVENDCFSNDNESVDFLTLKHEILEQSFQFLSEGVVNGSCPNEKNCTNNENLQYDDLHTYSMYCSMSIMEFKNNVEKLNVINYVKKAYEEKQLPFHLFITGGAGVGKTYTTKILIAYLQLFCTAQLNTNSVVVCAPTGTAASHINGQTIHSLFKIPVAQHLTYSSLSGFTLKKLRDYFQNVHTVIIDEISMVSSDIFSFINRRLVEIKSSDLPFGGLNVIVIGDFFQLRPVQGSFLFTNNILWDLFHPLFLNENMRQHEDGDFYSLLNRVRYGIITQSDEQLLKTRLLQCN